jgi:hypothetical protein
VVIDVIAAANAVIVTQSQSSVLIVGVADEVIAVTRGDTLFEVSVPAICPEPTTVAAMLDYLK